MLLLSWNEFQLELSVVCWKKPLRDFYWSKISVTRGHDVAAAYSLKCQKFPNELANIEMREEYSLTFAI